MITVDKKDLYNLKWEKTNNPNGWIEPTTHCQLKCEGCYRGLAEKNPLRIHKDLNKLKKEIDWFIEKRNVQTISIAGGEPLMYPPIEKLVEYISKKGLKTKIYTNALLLTEDKLLALKNAGVTEIIIHIDRFQRNSSSEKLMNELRKDYCDLFRKVKDINLGFIMPLSKKNIYDLDVLAPFFKMNSDIINLVVFTVYKEMLPNKATSKDLDISMNEVTDAIKKSLGIEYCAYLGKKQGDALSWLFSLSAYYQGKYLGSLDKGFYKKIQERYYSKKGKYFITMKNKPLRMTRLLSFLFNKSARNIFLNALMLGIKKVNTQVILIIDPPKKENNMWNLCDGCPDAMLHNKTLVPSCLLERIKSGEHIHIS